jgi:hypothetical protein
VAALLHVSQLSLIVPPLLVATSPMVAAPPVGAASPPQVALPCLSWVSRCAGAASVAASCSACSEAEEGRGGDLLRRSIGGEGGSGLLFQSKEGEGMAAVVWTSLGPLPQWVPGPTTRWALGTTRLVPHGT